MLKMFLSRSLLFCIFTSLFVLFNCSSANADNDTEALAKEAQNPVADIISVPFQDNINFGIGPYDRTQNVLNIQPVIPFHLNHDWNLITRTILPVIHQPKVFQSSGAIDGLGDLNPTLFLSPNAPGKLIWGLGPVFLIPTATDHALGTGKWGIGPSVVALTMPGHWVLGALANNIWSVAGEHNRPNVNQFLLQYFVNYNFPKGWYVTTSPIITADWTAKSENIWTVPFGAGFGRLFKVDKLPINVSMQGFYNVWKPQNAADWTLRLQVQFLFPS